MADAAHDLFTSTCPALGHLVGNICARTTPATLDDLARIVGAGLVRTALHGADRGLFD